MKCTKDYPYPMLLYQIGMTKCQFFWREGNGRTQRKIIGASKESRKISTQLWGMHSSLGHIARR